MEEKLLANIHSFDSLGAVDGPGLRFIIFFQGCHLRCKYCHNRDAVEMVTNSQYSVDDLVTKVLKYKNYFTASGGGVTVSGGEPLLQQDFLIEFFRELKKHNISTAIDTSGMVPITDKLKQLIELTDLFLLDIKCINDTICKDLVGMSNKLELEFAKYLSNINKDVWIRQVIVPGYTDNPHDLLDLKNFLSTLKNVKKIDLLPYHNLGKFKWKDLGLPYELENTRSATTEDIENAKNILGL